MNATEGVPKLEIPRGAVTSSNIVSIGYHAPTQELAVEFKSGHVYHHKGVPASLVDDLDQAESKGRFYAANIKGKFKSELMTGICPKCNDLGWVNRTCEDCGTAKYAPLDREHRDER